MLRTLVAYLREMVAVEDADERIEGSGEVILDPAYNSRYEGERELQRLSNVDDQEQENEFD
jgi:hypothetical protein